MAASADSSVRAITVPDKLNGSSGGGSRVTTVWVIVLTLLALVLALLMPWR